MTNTKLFPVIVFSCAALGCSSGRLDKLEADVRSIRSELQDLRAITADQTASLSSLRTDVRQLTGKADELNFKVAGKTAELERTLESVSSRVPPPPGVPAELLNNDDAAIARITGPEADQYRNGLRLLRNGVFEQARETFQSFVEANRQTAFSDNALFWVGISSMGLGQYDRAIGAFSEAFQKYPGEDMYAPAIYQMAECFVKLGQNNDAALSFQKLVDDRPRSEWAARAKTRLKEIAPPAPAKKKR